MKKLLTIATIVLTVSCPTQANIIVKYDFGPTYATRTLAPSAEADNISGSDFGYTGSSSADYTEHSGYGEAYNVYGGWDDISYTDYFYFTVTIDDGWSLDVTSLQFDSKVSNMYGPEYARVTYVINPENIIEDNIDIWYSGWQDDDATNTAMATPPTGQGLTGDVIFRIYAKGAGSGGGGFAVDNVILNGIVTPEPATIALLGLGSLTLLRRKRSV